MITKLVGKMLKDEAILQHSRKNRANLVNKSLAWVEVKWVRDLLYHRLIKTAEFILAELSSNLLTAMADENLMCLFFFSTPFLGRYKMSRMKPWISKFMILLVSDFIMQEFFQWPFILNSC